jgi:hypothetical protein
MLHGNAPFNSKFSSFAFWTLKAVTEQASVRYRKKNSVAAFRATVSNQDVFFLRRINASRNLAVRGRFVNKGDLTASHTKLWKKTEYVCRTHSFSQTKSELNQPAVMNNEVFKGRSRPTKFTGITVGV